MKTVDIVLNNYDFLNDLYRLTKNQPILLSDNMFKPYKTKILKNWEILKNFNILDEQDGIITWKYNKPPSIEIAYNFYYAKLKKSKTFSDVKEILENPANYTSLELMEAIEFNGLYKKETGQSLINGQEEDIPIINEEKDVKSLKPITIFSDEYKKLNELYLKLKKDYQEIQTENTFLKLIEAKRKQSIESEKQNSVGNEEMCEYMRISNQIFKKISEDIDKFASSNGSFRKVIGMLNSIQINNIKHTKIMHAILLEMQANLTESNIHESIDNRRQNIQDALQISKELNIYNDNNARYLPSEKNNN
jgi:hypothetical protein